MTPRTFLAAVVVAAVAFVAVTLVIRSGESKEVQGPVERGEEVQKRLAERLDVKVKSCRETSLELFYRCKLETRFRYSGMGESEDDWCVDSGGEPIFAIKSRTESRRCD
jgi:hypothetical protein